jgi:glycosyltransferase involved in cell wall biosynthesis
MNNPSENPRPFKLLCLCDSPDLQTGFARVAQNLLSRWHASGAFEQIWVWGIGYNGFPHMLPYYLCPAVLLDFPHWHQPVNLARFVSALENDHVGATPGGFTHVWIMQDTFALTPLTEDGRLRTVCRDMGIKSFLYFPVDAPLDPEWTRIIAEVDHPFAYCEYGRQAAVSALSAPLPLPYPPSGNTRRRNAKVSVLPHGVDTGCYRKIPVGEEGHKEQARTVMFSGHVGADDFLLVNVSQNQKRKALWHSMEVVAAIRALRPDLNAKLYIHAPSANKDEGLDLRHAASQLGLIQAGAVFFSDKNFNRGHALLDEHQLNAIYNAADVLISTSFGEGWGLPLTEAMAAGTAVAGPRHTSIGELLADDRGILFDTSGHEMVVWDNSRLRPRTDILDAAHKLIAARDTPPDQFGSLAGYAARGQAWARTEFLNWDRIAKEWLAAFGVQ